MAAHDHAHDSVAGDASAGASRARPLLIAFGLTATMLVTEAIGGLWSGSLALLADAGHMLVDAGTLLFSYVAARVAARPADALRSFGYARFEVLAGYSNALMQFVLIAWIVVEALLRLRAPLPIKADAMLGFAIGGLVVNIVVLRVLAGSGHDHADGDRADLNRADLNRASARLHVLGDLLASIGAIVAAALIWMFGWLRADAMISIVVSLLIFASAWRLLVRSAHILLEGVPDGIDVDSVRQLLKSEADGVHDVHHVHLWQIAGGFPVATLHARLRADADAQRSIGSIRSLLSDRFRIEHATVQVESVECEDGRCAR